LLHKVLRLNVYNSFIHFMDAFVVCGSYVNVLVCDMFCFAWSFWLID
jgi:hypothetical protein